MKHSLSEIYNIQGLDGVFTTEAAAEAEKMGYRVYHPYTCPAGKKGYRKLYLDWNKTSYKLIYPLGEKAWFDTEEERANYRIEQSKIKEEKRARLMIKKEIEQELLNYSSEELKKVLEMIRGA